MKKIKLHLAKETVRQLATQDLDRVAGGSDTVTWFNCSHIGCAPPKTPACPR